MTSHKDVSPEMEKAVQTLLKPPHVYYLQELHNATAVDPTYIFNNEATVGSNVQQILASAGVPDVMKREWSRVLGMAFHRMEVK